MTWQYSYTPAIWPMLGSAVFMAALAIFGSRRRHAPAAVPFVAIMWCFSAWALFSTLNVAAVVDTEKILWFKAERICATVVAIPSLCFALEFAGLGRWVTRRNVALISIIPTLNVLLILTSNAHQLLVTRLWFDGVVRLTPGPLYPFTTAFSYVLTLLNTAIFLWLFARTSGLYRWQVGLVVFGGLVPRAGVIPELLGYNLLTPLDLTILTADVMAVCYAVALFRFGMFDIQPVARSRLLGLMREGMLVLDAQDRVVELNAAAGRLLRIHQGDAVGKPAAEALARFPNLAAVLGQPGTAHAEVTANESALPRSFEVFISHLTHERGWSLGRLVLLYDITERLQARQQLLAQQAAVAALREREQMARELHDGLGQVLGYVKMQTEAVRSLLAQGCSAEADTHLARLMTVVQDAHADVRDFILEASGVSPIDLGLCASLDDYVQRFSQTHQIRTEVEMPPEMTDDCFDPDEAVQLLRIIQEALTNARKHADASHIRICLTACDGAAEVTITDDGHGFDPQQADGNGFGLRFMAERAQAVGGSLQVRSASGQGTTVRVQVPLRKDSAG